MKNIIFIEGVSGVGKSTTVSALGGKLRNLGYSVSCHFEGDPDSPLDLCWTAYLTIPEYETLIASYPEYANEFLSNIIFQGEYILLRYQVGRKKLYSQCIHDELHKLEFCYNPTNIVPLSKFTEVFLNLWNRFAESDEVKMDYVIFDASLVSHMTNDLVRNYNAAENEMVRHLEVLLETVKQLNPIVFYLSSQDVAKRLIKARQCREQTPPTGEQIKFWEKRKQMDSSVLSRLLIESHIKDISQDNWNSVIDEIVSHVTKLA